MTEPLNLEPIRALMNAPMLVDPRTWVEVTDALIAEVERLRGWLLTHGYDEVVSGAWPR